MKWVGQEVSFVSVVYVLRASLALLEINYSLYINKDMI